VVRCMLEPSLVTGRPSTLDAGDGDLLGTCRASHRRALLSDGTAAPLSPEDCGTALVIARVKRQAGADSPSN
jgi:hypothetical protein